MANALSILATVWIGSVINSPNTGTVAEAVTTVSNENNRKFTGSPRKLPLLTALNDLPYREKSPKFSIGPEKYDTTSAIARDITGIEQPAKLRSFSDRLRPMLPMPAWITR